MGSPSRVGAVGGKFHEDEVARRLDRKPRLSQSRSRRLDQLAAIPRQKRVELGGLSGAPALFALLKGSRSVPKGCCGKIFGSILERLGNPRPQSRATFVKVHELPVAGKPRRRKTGEEGGQVPASRNATVYLGQLEELGRYYRLAEEAVCKQQN